MNGTSRGGAAKGEAATGGTTRGGTATGGTARGGSARGGANASSSSNQPKGKQIVTTVEKELKLWRLRGKEKIQIGSHKQSCSNDL
jgi:hypothetical protein